MATTTLKLDWDDNTIAATRVACLAVAEVYEAMADEVGALPGHWNLKEAAQLRNAASDMALYVASRETVKQSQVVDALLNRQAPRPVTDEQEN